MTTLYVLELEDGKYYVGTTTRSVDDRFLEHINECGSAWSKKHKPISVIETKENVDKYDEDKYTKMYMDKYGIDNVRGGSYVSIQLPDYQLKALQYELKTSNDQCFRCRRTNHYANECYATTDVNGELLEKSSRSNSITSTSSVVKSLSITPSPSVNHPSNINISTSTVILPSSGYYLTIDHLMSKLESYSPQYCSFNFLENYALLIKITVRETAREAKDYGIDDTVINELVALIDQLSSIISSDYSMNFMGVCDIIKKLDRNPIFRIDRNRILDITIPKYSC